MRVLINFLQFFNGDSPNLNIDTYLQKIFQCGFGSSILGQCGSGSIVLMIKNWENFTSGKNSLFSLSKIAIYLSLYTREAFSSQKRASSTSNMKFLDFFLFCGSFLPLLDSNAGNSRICVRFEEYNKMVDTESESEDDPPEVPLAVTLLP